MALTSFSDPAVCSPFTLLLPPPPLSLPSPLPPPLPPSLQPTPSSPPHPLLQNAVAHLVSSNQELKAAIEEEGDDEDRTFKTAIEVRLSGCPTACLGKICVLLGLVIRR